MEPMPWFERKFTFGFAPNMLPFLLERLEGTICRIREKVSHQGGSKLEIRENAKWSVKENIGHLYEVDEISGKRIGEIVIGQRILSRADVQLAGVYNDMGIREVIDQFAERRRNHISRLLSLTEEELRLTALHPRLNVPMSPVDLAWFDAEHDDHHLVRINAILKRTAGT